MDWINNNLLALYGAIVGTIALILNFGRFLIMYQKSKRKLKVESSIHENAQKTLDALANPPNGWTGGTGSLCGPIYVVNVINTSHVQMHINDAGIIIKDRSGRSKIEALVRGSHFLSNLEESGGENIAPGSRKSFMVWLKKDSIDIPEIVGCYVADQLGNEYKGKHHQENIVLSVPKMPKNSSQQDAEKAGASA